MAVFAILAELCMRRSSGVRGGLPEAAFDRPRILLLELIFEGTNTPLHLLELLQQRSLPWPGRIGSVALSALVLGVREADAERRCGQHHQDAPLRPRRRR